MRNRNGVTVRHDKLGDHWANEHRTCVDREHLMTDVDGLFGAMFYHQETSDQLWLEYMHADRWRHGSDFRVIAIIERKASIPEPGSNKRRAYETQRDFLCWLTRMIGAAQTVTPRLLYVINEQGGHSKWKVLRVDPHAVALTGESWMIERGASWREVWDAAGLTDVRIALRDMVAGQ